MSNSGIQMYAHRIMMPKTCEFAPFTTSVGVLSGEWADLANVMTRQFWWHDNCDVDLGYAICCADA